MSQTTSFESSETDVEAFRGAISQVLDREADRLTLHKFIDGESDLDLSLWREASQLGWLAIGLVEGDGGLGLGPKGLDMLYRELGARVSPGPFMAALAAIQVLSEVADDEIRSVWLPRMASGDCKVALAAECASSNTGDGIWLLGDPGSDAALIPLDDDRWGLVPLTGADKVDTWDRTRQVIVLHPGQSDPVAVLPGSFTAASVRRHLSLAVASDSIGGSRAILELTVAYMKEREQFGKPVASFQALKHRVADMMTSVVSGEEIVSLATEAVAMGMPDADIWVNLAKARATETYTAISTDCLQLHGGVGFTWEFDVHLYLNRARLNEMLVAANTAMKDGAAAALADAVLAGREPLALPL